MQSSQNTDFIPRMSVQLSKNISTNSNSSSIELVDEISNTFAKIHDTIDNLDSKVNLLLDKHEAEFLFAWRNHIKKIKKQLHEIKQKSDEKQRLLNSNERVIAMEKQTILFRDQALKLYEEVEQRKGEVQICRRKIKEQQTALQILKSQNKQLIKRSKMSQARSNIYSQKISEIEKELSRYQPHDSPSMSVMNHFDIKMNLLQNGQNRIQSKTVGIQKFKDLEKSFQKPGLQSKKKSFSIDQDFEGFAVPKQKYLKSGKLTYQQKWKTNSNIVNSDTKIGLQELVQPKKKLSLINKTYNSSFMMIQPKIYENELKNWFLECIRTIKKQISSRKAGFTSPSMEILKVQSLQEFKTIDKLRLLEMFLQNQKLLVYMYQKIFPDRLKQIETYLLTIPPVSQIQETNQRKLNALDSKNVESVNNGSNMAQNNQMMQVLDGINQKRDENKIRVKPITKGSKSQPIRNRIMMRDGRLNLFG